MSIEIQTPLTLESALGYPAGLDRTAIMERVFHLDEVLWRHASSVAQMVATVANAGLDCDIAPAVLIDAAWLHDIGKLTIPRSILDKPGQLDAQEWGEMRSHPIRGAEYLKCDLHLGPIAALVRSHHEWHNGAGYPDGRRGEDTPIGARLIGIADAFDAMTSWRPYRAQRSNAEAAAELSRCAGSQFDPELVDRFLTTATTLRKDSN